MTPATVTATLITNPSEDGTPGIIRFGRDTTGSPLDVQFNVSGTATPGSDFTSLPASVTFGPSDATVDLPINALPDNVSDPSETVVVGLLPSPFYTVGSPAVATATITDTTPVITVAKINNATEGGAVGTIRFTRTGDTSQALMVNYGVSGLAAPGADYTALSGIVTFAPGSATADVLVNALSDDLTEGSETVTVTVLPGSNYAVGASPVADLTVIDKVYGDTFSWNGVATVQVLVTYDAPGHAGQYVWNYHLTNDSFSSGIANFALPAEDAGMVSGRGSSPGWSDYPGTFLSNSDLIAWTNGTPLGIGNSADFWFTTTPVEVALTNGIITDAGVTTQPGGFLAVPTAAVAAPTPPQPFPYPAILVATKDDTNNPNNDLTSLREAINYVNEGNAPSLRERKIRFSSSLNGETITLGFLGTLEVKKDIWINGTERNIKITVGGLFIAGRLIKVDEGTTAIIEGLELEGDPARPGGAIESYGNLTVKNCDIHDHTADRGAGIAARKGELTIVDCDIHNNHAETAFGDGRGGGVDIYDAVTSATITNTWIYLNTSDDRGGGIYIVGGDAEVPLNTTVTLDGVRIFENEAVNLGGGIAVSTLASPQLVLKGNTRIEDNSATGTNSQGGGVYLGAGTVSYNGVTFANNTAATGDGIFLFGGAGTSGTAVTWVNNSEYWDD